MYKNSLIQVLKKLSKKEMTRFQEFAQSPYHCKHQDTQNLVTYFNFIYPNLNEKKCSRENIFKALYPQESHDQQQLFLVFTYTQKLFDQFLVQERLKDKETAQNICMLEWLRKKKQLDLWEKKLKTATKTFQKISVEDSDYYYGYYQLYTEQYNYQIVSNQKPQQYLTKKQLYLDKFFTLEKLRDACELAIRSNMANTTQNIFMLTGVLQEIENHPDRYAENPLIIIYFQLYKLLQNSAEDQYFLLRKTFAEKEVALPLTERQSIYNYFQNYCIARINGGDKTFLPELFLLYQEQLNNELLLQDPFLFEWHYKNIVTLGLRIGKTEWVGKFVEDYQKYLPLASRENAYTFNRAAYFYAIQQYHEVLLLLTQMEYSQLQYSLGAKTLLLRTYYELNEQEALLSLTDAFRQFLLRNKTLPNSRAKAFHNLIKLTRKLQLLRSKKEFTSRTTFTKECQKLTADIQSTPVVINQFWLLEKMKSL